MVLEREKKSEMESKGLMDASATPLGLSSILGKCHLSIFAGFYFVDPLELGM